MCLNKVVWVACRCEVGLNGRMGKGGRCATGAGSTCAHERRYDGAVWIGYCALRVGDHSSVADCEHGVNRQWARADDVRQE